MRLVGGRERVKGTDMTGARTRIQIAVQAEDRTVELLHVYLSQKV